MITPFKAWAPTYLSLGWSPIPLPSSDKAPPPDHSPITGRKQPYTGGSGKYVDVPDLQAWSAPTGRATAGKWHFPPGNVGLRLPQLCLGIDVDTYGGKAGAATLAAAEKLWGSLPATWSSANRVTEPKSGIRLYRLPEFYGGGVGGGVGGAEGVRTELLDWPESLKSVVGADLGGGVELIRWDHRFAVVAPSVHPDGRVYFWRKPDGSIIDLAALALDWANSTRDGVGSDGMEVELPDLAECTELPEAWITGLTGGRLRGGVRGAGAAGNDGSGELSRAEVKAWLAERTHTLGPDLCAVMDRTLARYLTSLRSAGDDGGAHDTGRDGAWAVLGDAAAGHAGVEGALASLRQAFLVAVDGRRGGAGTGERVTAAEWARIVIRGVSKIVREGEPAPEDRCVALGRRGTAFDYTRDDRGNARRLYNALGHGSDVRWCCALGGWFMWDTDRWVSDAEGLALKAVFAKIVDEITIEAEAFDGPAPVKAALLRFANGCGNLGRFETALKMLRALPGVSIEPERFDAAERLLLCENGVLELNSSGVAFRPSAREDYLTISTGVKYIVDADVAIRDVDVSTRTILQDSSGVTSVATGVAGVNAGAALWENFLADCLPDLEVRNWVQAAVGYSLLGRNTERKLFVCQGPTSSGKSTFVEAIRAALGRHSAPFNFSLFRSEKEQGSNVALVRLLPKRFIVASEASQNRHLHADEVKRITGNEGLAARLNNANEMLERAPAFTPWIATNSAPTINGADAALYRRLVTIPFLSVVEEGAEDVDLGERLRAESLPAILAWAAKGWDLYCGGVLRKVPEPIHFATLKMRGELSDFAVWLNARTEPGDVSVVTPTDVLYADWEAWCDVNNVPVGSKPEFGRALSRNGYVVAQGRSGARRFGGYRGIGIRP